MGWILKKVGNGVYQMYSTVVMNFISPALDRQGMEKWIAHSIKMEARGYPNIAYTRSGTLPFGHEFNKTKFNDEISQSEFIKRIIAIQFKGVK